MNDPWPYPADTPLERSRKVAQWYRAALLEANPAQCGRVDDKIEELGQRWVKPVELAGDLDTLMSATEIANMFGLDARTVRQWGSRGHIERLQSDGKPMYLLRDIVDYMAATRRERSTRQRSA
ncbi:DNA-binding protein [Rhodococcus sp. Leaf233]|uniref:DNA-binding protein n=1 Tax=Rhodococcus sp. Leaf233 TaxID=1736302 RepID=UPI00070E30EB|nr:DNA-binding protein [Rhodococcus sp. Leaf233]KQU33555.1 hypothetical protein ASH04_06890 [Rhodococcus sp. Leaf233]